MNVIDQAIEIYVELKRIRKSLHALQIGQASKEMTFTEEVEITVDGHNYIMEGVVIRRKT